MTAEEFHYRNSGIDMCFCGHCPEAISDLEAYAAAEVKRVAVPLVVAIEEVQSLLKDGVLIRDISHDADFKVFMKDAMRVTNMIVHAQEALAAAKKEMEP